jgi:hypothetical protein
MKTDVVSQDCWIVGQPELARNRMLELELTDAFTMSSPGANEDLRRRVDELNSWLNLVDGALAVRTCSPWRPSLRGGRTVTLPICNSSRRLSAA